VSVQRAVILVVLLGLLAAAWFYITSDSLGDVRVPQVPSADDPVEPSPKPPKPPTVVPAVPSSGPSRRDLLHEARRLCAQPPLDRFLVEQRALVEADAEDAVRGARLHVLAEALLERIYCLNSHIGMTPGEPLYRRVPEAVESDVAEGLSALRKARTLGVALGDGYRVEAGLLTSRITGTVSAMGLKSKIAKAFSAALEADGEEPRLHVALGCRKLFAPRLLGRDLDKAMEHLVYACYGLPRDERPRIFAALTAYLIGDRESALAWAEKGLELNENNAFAKAVVERLRAGEADPFGRDL